MRVVVQRVSKAAVYIDGKQYSSIERGMLVLLGIEEADGNEDVDWLVPKLARLRIFPDAQGVMNRDIMEIMGEFLVVSQFTLHASTRKGNRPAYIRAARPESAIPLYEDFVAKLITLTGSGVRTGQFGAMMQLELVNDGPVTIIIDSRNRE
jgi:D-tyrosyl-tRNA(Tyr) deacylase